MNLLLLLSALLSTLTGIITGDRVAVRVAVEQQAERADIAAQAPVRAMPVLRHVAAIPRWSAHPAPVPALSAVLPVSARAVLAMTGRRRE